MADLIDIFGEDFTSVLASLDELPPQVEDMLLGVMDKMVYDVRTFSNSLEKSVYTMTQAGTSPEIIKQTLKNDMGTGGRIFGQLRNDTKASIVDGINQSAKMGQYKNYDLDKGEFVWVTVGGHKVCMDCDGRAGQKMTFAGWEAEGLPGSGWSVCQGFCYCVLDPTGKASKKIDAPVKEPGRKKIIKEATKEGELGRIKKFLSALPGDPKFPRSQGWLGETLARGNIKPGVPNFVGIPTKRLTSIANALQDTLGRFNVNVQYLGTFTRGLQKRKANAAAWLSSQNNVIGWKKSYVLNAEKVSEGSRKGFLYHKTRAIETAKEKISEYKLLKKQGKGHQVDYWIDKYEKQLIRLEDPRFNKWSISSIADDPLYATSKHESWHQLDLQLNTEKDFMSNIFKKNLDDLAVTRDEWYFVSEYAGTGQGTESSALLELWAETGTAIDMKIPIPENIKRAFIKTLNDAGFDYP